MSPLCEAAGGKYAPKNAVQKEMQKITEHGGRWISGA